MEKKEYITTSQLITLAKKHSGLTKEVLTDSLHALLAAVSESVDAGNTFQGVPEFSDILYEVLN